MTELEVLENIKKILKSETIDISDYISKSYEEENPVYDEIVALLTRLIEKKEKLNYENEYIRKVIEMTDEAVITLSEENKIIFVNRCFTEMFKLNARGIYGLSVSDIPQLRPLDGIITGNSEMEIKRMELSINGEKSVFSIKIKVMSGNLRDKIVMIRDISEEMRFADIIGETKQIMAMGDLVSGIAHEIRNPLTPIRGLLQIIKNNMSGKSESFDKYLEIIFQEIDKINAKIENLNKFAESSTNEKTNIEIDELLNIALTEMIASKVIDTSKINIDKNFNTKGCTIPANKAKLIEAIENIIKNSCEAIEGKGTIMITTSYDMSSITIAISDTGKGIKKEMIKNVMNPFFTTKEHRKAMGIGLTIAQKVINSHNGKLVIDSEESKGTTARITFYV